MVKNLDKITPMLKPIDILLGLTLLTGSVSKVEAAPAELQATSEATREKTELCLNLDRTRRVKEVAPDITQLLMQLTEGGMNVNLHTPDKPNGHTLVLVNDIHLDPTFDNKIYKALKNAGIANFALEGWNGQDNFHLNGQSNFVEGVLKDPAVRCLGVEEDALRIDAFLSNILLLELNRIFAERYLEEDIKERNPEARQEHVTMAVEGQKARLKETQVSLAESVFLIKARGKVDASAIKERLEATVWLGFQLNEAAQKAGLVSVEAIRESTKDRAAWKEVHERALAWRNEKTVKDRNIEAVTRVKATYQKNPEMGSMAVWFGEGHRDDLLPRLLAEGFNVLEVSRMQGDDRESLEMKQIESIMNVIDEMANELRKQEPSE